MTERFVKGNDYKDKGNDLKTYGITDTESVSALGKGITVIHTNKIEIFGDRILRDKIIKLLNKQE